MQQGLFCACIRQVAFINEMSNYHWIGILAISLSGTMNL